MDIIPVCLLFILTESKCLQNYMKYCNKNIRLDRPQTHNWYKNMRHKSLESTKIHLLTGGGGGGGVVK